MKHYLENLNPYQYEAVLKTEGPLIVLAGAGSGKTKMLTARIAYLMDEKSIPASQILAVTFTNKAAAEMYGRVMQIFGGSYSLFERPEIGTFHSVCVKILKTCLPYTPFSQAFVIYDDGEQLSLIKSLLKKRGLDDKQCNPKSIQGIINRAKCDAISPEEFLNHPHSRIFQDMKGLYAEYQKELFAQNALDFGEILCMVYRIFKKHPEVLASYQKRFRYIHVDEYQDTNRIQYLLLSLLASSQYGGSENICVVGDEDQSIYRWRGADIRNILDFEKEYPHAAVVKLEQNYRSTKNIISAASELIGANEQRKDKVLWTENELGDPLVRFELSDEREEAEKVVAEIRRLSSSGLSYSDFAIFYRTNAQSRQFEDVLRREKIQYQIYGGLRFYDRKEIKDILSYLRVVLNPLDSMSLKRILNVPARGLGKTTLDALEESVFAWGGNFWDAIQRALHADELGEVPEPAFSRGALNRFKEFVQLIELFQKERLRLSLRALYHLVLEKTGYLLSLQKEKSEEAQQRVENLKEFETLLQEFEAQNLHLSPEDALPVFIEQSSLDTIDHSSPEEGQAAVKLMTLHSSKGLEFPVVFMVGMEERLFPSTRGWDGPTQEEIEEERRLCYVGMTRARKQLYLLHVTIRHLWGQMSFQRPSRFLDEIPARFFQVSSSLPQGRGIQKVPSVLSHSNLGAIKASKAVLSSGYLGRRVLHPDYGSGVVVGSEGFGETEKVTIEFEGRLPVKKFLLRYVNTYLQ